MNIFERAAREKIRFDYLGIIQTEDLWDLKIEQLDDLYRQINSNLKDQSGEGLIKDESVSEYASLLQLQVDLVRHVFEAKLELMKTARNEKLRQEKKKRIMEIIADKQDQELMDKPTEDLMKMLNEM